MITGTSDLGDGVYFVTVDHDPQWVNTNVPAGSFIRDPNNRLFVKLVGGDNVLVEQIAFHNAIYQSDVNPGVTDDVTKGFQIGSSWYNMPGRKKWICEDTTEGAAIW